MAAQALAVNGAKVYIVGRTAEKLETVVKTYSNDTTGNIIALTADVSKKDSIAKLHDELSNKEEHLDVSTFCPSQTVHVAEIALWDYAFADSPCRF
jgi:short-subunit dehydrogenase